VNVSPSAQTPPDSHCTASLQGDLGQRGDLVAALLDGTLTLSVDDGRQNESCLDGRCLLGDIENVVVDRPRLVGFEKVSDGCDASEVIPDVI
jgi:hypothetical protein